MNSATQVEPSKQEKITLRLDVDYAFPSRNKSFFFTALGIKSGRNYLKNSKIIARMVNESSRPIKAVWFFTPYTIPDKELLGLLNEEKHEVALHIANKPYKELERLEKATGRKVNYYTVHGTARLIARIIWKRKLWQARADVPKDFPLKSFYDFPYVGIDIVCHTRTTKESVKIAEKAVSEGKVLHVHPEWLLQRGTMNHRGPYYETLKILLQVDKDLDGLAVRKKAFFKMASFTGLNEYLNDHYPDDSLLEKLAQRNADVLTILERSWNNPLDNQSKGWQKKEDNVAMLKVDSYDAWWEGAGKKTRNMVRKAEKSGITVKVVEPSDKLAEGIWKIYNETPIRQGRAFPHYGQNLETVKGMFASKGETFIAAFLNDEVVGFIQLSYGDNIAIISQILSLQQHWDKAINNALIAKAVQVCASKNMHWVMYGRIGNHPSLDKFKENNSFVKYPLTRYYIPLSFKGRLAVALGLHRNLKDAIPEPIKKRLLGGYSWVSRTRGKA